MSHTLPLLELSISRQPPFCYEFYNILQYSCYNHFNAAGSKRQEKRPGQAEPFLNEIYYLTYSISSAAAISSSVASNIFFTSSLAIFFDSNFWMDWIRPSSKPFSKPFSIAVSAIP